MSVAEKRAKDLKQNDVNESKMKLRFEKWKMKSRFSATTTISNIPKLYGITLLNNFKDCFEFYQNFTTYRALLSHFWEE